MPELVDVPSEAKIRKFLRRIIFGKNIFCPGCRNRRVACSGQRYYCSRCRRRFSLLSHTWLANSKLPLRKLWVVVWCWTAQIPVARAESITNLSNKAIRYWYDSFRSHLPDDQAVLEAIVQLDEAYFGGWKGQTLLMAKQKGTRKLAYRVLPHTDPTRTDAIAFVRAFVKPGSVLYTDGSSIYANIQYHHRVAHYVDIHKAWEYSRTSEIEGVFGNLRTFIRRMYHHTTKPKLHEVVREFSYRFSHPELFKNPRYYLTNSLTLVPTG